MKRQLFLWSVVLWSVAGGLCADIATKTSLLNWSYAPGDQVAQVEFALTTTNVTSLSNATNPPVAIATLRVPGSQTNLAVTNLVTVNVASNYNVWARCISTNGFVQYSPWTNLAVRYIPPPQPPTLFITTP